MKAATSSTCRARTECFVDDCYVINAPVIGVIPGAAHITTGQHGREPLPRVNSTFKGNNVGIAAMRQFQNIIENNNILDSITYPVVIDEYSEQCEILNNRISGAGNEAIYLFRAYKNIVSNNTISTVASVGISLDDASILNLIEANYIQGAGNSAIVLADAADRNSVLGNVISAPTQWGISSQVGQSSAGRQTLIALIRVEGAGLGGISHLGAGSALINGNSCYDCNGSGIYVGMTAAGQTVVIRSRSATTIAITTRKPRQMMLAFA